MVEKALNEGIEKVFVSEKQLIAAAFANLCSDKKTFITHDEIILLIAGVANRSKSIMFSDTMEIENEDIFDYFVSRSGKDGMYVLRRKGTLDTDVSEALHIFNLYKEQSGITLRKFLNDFSTPELNRVFTERADSEERYSKIKAIKIWGRAENQTV